MCPSTTGSAVNATAHDTLTETAITFSTHWARNRNFRGYIVLPNVPAAVTCRATAHAHTVPQAFEQTFDTIEAEGASDNLGKLGVSIGVRRRQGGHVNRVANGLVA